MVGTVPQISAPASLAGVELVEHRWDLTVEYLLTQHPKVLWYSNSGFSEGYSHEGVVLGHPLGGGAEVVPGIFAALTISSQISSGVRIWSRHWRNGRPQDPSFLLVTMTNERSLVASPWRRQGSCRPR